MDLTPTSKWLSTSSRNKSLDRWMAAIAFAWPFLYLSPYLIPLVGRGRQSSNDFEIIYYRYKTYLLDVMSSQGSLPLWSPSEASGYPFFASPFTASAYPLNIPLAGAYRFLNGYSHHDHQIYSVLAVAIFSLGLYCWLRATRLPILPALLATAVFGVSMKITELLRMTNALHAAAWIPWILLGMTLLADRKKMWRGGATVAIATVFFLTAGYPYYIYYIQFLAGPYLLLLLARPTRTALFVEDGVEFPGATKFIVGQALAFGSAIAACAPYLLSVVGLVEQVHARGGTDYNFSTTAIWDIPSSLGALVFPPGASAEGWYYFGIIHLLVMLLFVVGALRRRDSHLQDKRLIWALLAFIVLISWITLGRESHFFWLMWQVWPGFSTLRHWPRINILLLPAFALLLGRAYFALIATLQDPAMKTHLALAQRLRTTTALYAGILIVQVAFLYTGYESYQWPLYFQRYFDHLPLIDKPWYLVMGAIAWLAVIALFVWAHRWPGRVAKRGVAALLFLAMLGALDVAPLGILQWSEPKKLQDLTRNRPRVIERMKLSLTRPRTAKYTTVTLSPDFNVSGIEDWYFERYISFIESQGLDKAALKQPERWSEDSSFAELLGISQGKRLFYSSAIDHATPAEFLADSHVSEAALAEAIAVERYTGDELVLTVTTVRDGYISFIDNWDSHWSATRNGKPVPIELLFGTFKAVAVPAGTSEIEFHYSLF
ncbi:MAG: hypothetical protein ACI8W3_001678 [Myxococcota bacterium]|jgi:hypothetical protein